MADAKAMSVIKTLLQTTQGATGEMLADGLSFALQDRPEERHELQVALLKMVNQVLSAARSDAELDAEETCKRKVDNAQADLDASKAAVAQAQASLEQAKATAVSQKEKLEESRRQLTSEETELKGVEAMDEEKSKEVEVVEQGKNEVVELLQRMKEQGSGETVLPYLRNNNAEAPLVAALQSVLKKEESDRKDFDGVAMDHLKNFLDAKVGNWESQIDYMKTAKANVHAEALGAWAIKQVAIEHVEEAVKAAEAADAAVLEAEQALKAATTKEQDQDRVLNHYLTDLTLAQDRVRQCSEALESLARLEKGQPMEVEVPTVLATGMEVDTEVVKMDTTMDAEMGVAITA